MNRLLMLVFCLTWTSLSLANDSAQDLQDAFVNALKANDAQALRTPVDTVSVQGPAAKGVAGMGLKGTQGIRPGTPFLLSQVFYSSFSCHRNDDLYVINYDAKARRRTTSTSLDL